MLSLTSEYAVRALAYLGTRKGRLFVLGRDIAHELDISQPLLGKVLQILTTSGLLESHRGHGGSFRLVHDPKSVTLLQIVDPFDHLSHPMRCVLGQRVCDDDRGCPLHSARKQSQNTLLEALRRTTLADVLWTAHSGGVP